MCAIEYLDILQLSQLFSGFFLEDNQSFSADVFFIQFSTPMDFLVLDHGTMGFQ